MSEYTIEVFITKKESKSLQFHRKRSVNINYNNEDFLLCEGLLKDTMKDLAHSAIEELWYK